MKNAIGLTLAGRPTSRELATILAALRNWQRTLSECGVTDSSNTSQVAKVVREHRPSFDHFEDEKPLRLPEIERLCLRIGLGPTPSIRSINLDPSKALDTSDSSILDQIEDLLVNQFGEDERPEISGDEAYELVRHIADDLLDQRKKPQADTETAAADIPAACECSESHKEKNTVCRFCRETKITPYIEHGGVSCPFCKSEDIEGGSVETDQGGAFQPVACNACGAEWNDVYELTTVAEIHPPEPSSTN
jgi:hypothetical protein